MRSCHLFSVFDSNSSGSENNRASGGQSSFNRLHGLTAKTCADIFRPNNFGSSTGGRPIQQIPGEHFPDRLPSIDAACPYLQFKAGITSDLAVVSVL